MANKPFAIQGSDLTLGGVNIQAGTDSIVIPGITQVTNYVVEEVDEMPNIGGQDLGDDAGAITVIDNAEYLYLVDDGDSPSADYVAATYSVDELDDGNIEEITVDTAGVFLAADKNRVEAANMWATLTPTPFVSFNTANWTQIPFRPKIRAGEVENIGGGADTGNFTFDENTIANGDGLILVTNRGTLAIGTNMETPGVAGHFHIGFDGSNSQANANDLFLGDDYNYVKLPGYELNPVDHGVEIGTHDRDGGNNYNWRFGTDGNLTFPDGTIQTTAYTGQNSGAIGTFFVVVNDDGTVSKSTDGVSWTTGADQGDGINRVATDGVTVAMIQSDQLSWTTFDGLEASTYVSGSSGTADEIGGQNIDWNQIDYAGGYFVAVGSYDPTGSSFTQGVYGYSTDGRIWTFETVDQTVVEFFGNDPVDSNWQFSDVDYNGVGWMFSVGGDGGANGGGVYITDLTATVTSARCFSMNRTYRAAWNGSAWYMESDGESSGNLAGVNTNFDPRNGTFDGPIDPWSTSIQDLGIEGGSTTELAGGNGYIAASDSDGHVAWSDDNGTTWQIVTPIPYTRTISAITQASPPVVTFSGSGNNGTSGEKVVISGSSVSGYNGTFYWKSADSSLYTDQILDTPFDTSGLAPFTGTATLTWSNGTYIDAMDYINGYFYIGNDDEQIARTTDFVSWTILDDQSSSEFDYWNDIAGFVGTGDIGNKLVNGNFEVVLDASGNLTADGDIKTGVDGGRFIQDCDDGTSSMRWINVEVESESTQLIRAYSGDPDGEGDSDERAQIKLNWQDEDRSGLTIRSFDRTDSMSTVSHDWNFAGDGDLYIPPGKTIRDAMTGDDLLAGGGTAGDANIWVQTFVSDTPLLDFPQIATSVEYDSDGNVIGLFSHFDDNNGASYFSVGKYTDTGTKIWTARLSDDIQTDGWGLAVDPVDGWIYVAGQSGGVENPTYPYAQATLTKIDPLNGSYDWHKVYDFGYASASAVVDVDSDGNPIMVGYVDVGGNSNESYLAVTKISKTDGTVLWSRKLDGQADEQAYGMAVGPNNEVVAVGYMSQLAYGANNATVTVVTVPGSNVNWVTDQPYTLASVDLNITFDAGVPTITVVQDLIGGRTIGVTLGTILGSALGGVDGDDDMVVNVATISAVGDQDDRIVVVKYNSAGAIQWQRAIQFDSGFDSTGADADIDSQGNVYICGQYEVDGAADSGMALIKFNSAGVKQWSRRVVGDCISVATSIVVGPDDKLYISGVNGNDFTETFVWVVAKYSLDGLVEWQRFMENTTTWSFSGQLFNNSAGGSNLAVRQGYVALSGGFGNLSASEQTYATLVQVPATGNVFTVGNWDFKAANLSGVLNSSASDITVVDAGLTNSDNAGAIEVGTIGAGDTEVGNFLIGTLYTAPGGNDSLVNGGNQLVLESTGTLTLPQGGTITEGYVTSNPTIQLTPASPSVASQKLVIKGGGSYSNTENGIYLSTNNITWAVSTTVEFYVYDPTRANETLYWWIVPEGAGISTTMSGTVALDGIGDGNFTFTLDSDAYEFRVRVSPEDNNYDPNNTGVESVLINGDEPTFEGEHHLHLTTGNLAVTSIFLGTDDHNVRTTVDGKIQITTPDEVNKVWEFGTDGTTTFPTLTVPISDNATPNGTGQTLKFSDSSQQAIIFGPVSTVSSPSAERIIIQGAPGYTGTTGEGGDVYVWAGPGGSTNGDGGDIKVRAGYGPGTGQGGYLNFQAGDSATGDGGWINIESGESGTYGLGGDITVHAQSGGEIYLRTYTSTGTNNDWLFGNNGSLTLPGSGIVSDTNGTPGLTRKTYTAVTGWFNNDSTWFETNATVASTTVITGTIAGSSTETPGYAEQLYGYFKAPSTATYTFGLHVDDAGMFWIGDDAVDGSFDDANANITYVWPSTVATYSLALTKDVYYPIRIQWGNNDGTAPNFGSLNEFWYSTDGGTTPQTNFTNTIYTEPGLTTVSKGGNEWTFGTDGALTLAKDIIVGNNGGHIYQDAGQAGNPSSIKWVNMTGANNMLRVFADDRTTMADERLNVAWDDGNGFNITTYSTTDSTWTFGIDGTTTLPGTVVNSTATTPTTTGIPNNFTLSTGNNTNLTPGNYSNILVGFTGKNLLLGVQVSSEHNITIYGPLTATPATFIIGDNAVINGDLIGGATPADDLTITVDTLDLVAIDLTKTINKLADGDYVLGDGVEGQIMYLVGQTGAISTEVGVTVANYRVNGSENTGGLLLPFRVYDYSDESYYDSFSNICTLIFTDGAWQQSGGAWD